MVYGCFLNTLHAEIRWTSKPKIFIYSLAFYRKSLPTPNLDGESQENRNHVPSERFWDTLKIAQLVSSLKVNMSLEASPSRTVRDIIN